MYNLFNMLIMKKVEDFMIAELTETQAQLIFGGANPWLEDAGD